MFGYSFIDIEKKWQAYWEEQDTFRTPEEINPNQPKYYVLDMFPYPSGVGLHVGHPLGYIATDIVARYKRMTGMNVLHPMGFDAFGLPAEQYAVEHGIHPRITTEKNIQNMVSQLKRLGLSYDWSRKISTTDTTYYKWTQWIFLKLYNSYYDTDTKKATPISALKDQLEQESFFVDDTFHITKDNNSSRSWNTLTSEEKEQVLANYRLTYISEVPVNWCPGLGTVLANEEVTNEGRSERGNYPVFKRPLKQWMMRITAFAERLLYELDDVDWPEPIKLMQRNWIGRSDGAHILFSIKNHESERLKVFTTRPDTIFGATYVVLAPEHPLVEHISTPDRLGEVRAYRRGAEARSDIERMAEGKEKTGVFTGAYAINPVNGVSIPIWIADYVLSGYGTGAIMAVPGQDQRDWDFAETFDLPIVRTVQPPDDFEGKAYTGEGIAINSDFLNGLSIAEAKKSITDWLIEHEAGDQAINYKLRDWLFSRQRYWGEPFPIIHHPGGTVYALPDSSLPVVLPEMENFSPSASDDPDAPPVPPLGRASESWRFLEKDGVVYSRELNTMPQWAGSCWYFLRFIDPENPDILVDPEKESYWMGENGVDLYVGGAEHAVLHLLYARFWHKALFDLGFVSTKEPFGRLFNQGYIQAYAYRDARGIAVPADDVVDQDGNPATEVQDQPGRTFYYQGKEVTQEYGKMGKSLKNSVNPDDICEQYGCDTLRLYEMYMGPLEASKPWNTRDIIGSHRFLRRVWRNFVDDQKGDVLITDNEATDELLRLLNRTIKRVTESLDRLSFNTAIAALIEMNNSLVSTDKIPRVIAEPFLLMLAPLAPHISEELWERLGHSSSLAYESWPQIEEKYLQENTIKIAVQINGKVRASIEIPVNASKDEALMMAKDDEAVARYLDDKTLRREIYVPKKIINFVVS